MALDPTTFAILRSSFINIANGMGLTLGKVAYSPVITEGRDFAGAVYDADGQLVACGEHDLTGLLGTMEPTIQFIFDWLGKENLHEGDVVFVNSRTKPAAISTIFARSGRSTGKASWWRSSPMSAIGPMSAGRCRARSTRWPATASARGCASRR